MFNKELGVIRLIIGNKGPRISAGTKVTFENMDKLIVGRVLLTHGYFQDNVWHVQLLDVNEYAQIYIEVNNESSGYVDVIAEVTGENTDPNPSDNTYVFHIGKTGVAR